MDPYLDLLTNLGLRDPVERTPGVGALPLPAQQEADFQKWYRAKATEIGISPNPDGAKQQYDYRAAWMGGAGTSPDPTDNNRPHWPSTYKLPDHPNRFVRDRNGNLIDSITGRPVR